MFHTSHLLPTKFSPKLLFLKALTFYLNKFLNKLNNKFRNNLSNLCYFCYSKKPFIIIIEFFCQKYRLPYSHPNILISLISQALISPYLIHSVNPPSTHCVEGGEFRPGGDLLHWIAVFT